MNWEKELASLLGYFYLTPFLPPAVPFPKYCEGLHKTNHEDVCIVNDSKSENAKLAAAPHVKKGLRYV